MRTKTILVLGLALAAALLASDANAESVDTYIAKAAKAHGVNPKLLRLIIEAESDFNQNAINAQSHDYGLGQINKTTAALYGFSLSKLKTSAQYNVNAAAIVLKDFERIYKKKEPLTWPCRYNVGTGPLHLKAGKCAAYLKRLNAVAERRSTSGYRVVTVDFFN